MRWCRVSALLWKYVYIMRHDLDRVFDIVYWPIVGLFTWGFTTFYLRDVTGDSRFIAFLLGGFILWTMVERAQQDISVFLLQDFWNQNIYNTFSSPLSNLEIFTATALFALGRSVVTFGFLLVLAYGFYAMNLLSFDPTGIAALVGALVVFGAALGITVAGLIYRYGMRIQIFAFSIAFLMQPFSAVFYPRDTLPGVFHTISLAVPPSYVFEGMRATMRTGTVPWGQVGTAFGLGLVYLAGGYLVYAHFLERSRQEGFLARNT